MPIQYVRTIRSEASGVVADAIGCVTFMLIYHFPVCDQFFWATRVRATGNGLRGPNANDLTSGSLEQSLRALLSDDKYAETAKEVATRVRSEKSFERVARRVRAALQQ